MAGRSWSVRRFALGACVGGLVLAGACSAGGQAAPLSTTVPAYLEDDFVGEVDQLCISSEAASRRVSDEMAQAFLDAADARQAGDAAGLQAQLALIATGMQESHDTMTGFLGRVEALGVPEEHRATIDELHAYYQPYLTSYQQATVAFAAGDHAGFDAIAEAAPDRDEAREQELADQLGAPSCGPG